MSFIRNVHHIIFSTKNRAPWIAVDLEDALYGYMGGILRERKGALVEAGGMPDHVHLLVALHQTTSIADMVRDIKAGSSAWMHEKGTKWKEFSWQTKYASFSVSLSMEETVRGYIRGQKEHHKKVSYQEEVREILARHGIEVDERYMWE